MSCEKVYYSDLFKKIANGQKAMLNHGVAQNDITYVQSLVLLFLNNMSCQFGSDHEVSQKDVEDYLLLKGSTVTRLLSRMEESELIQRVRSQKDCRSNYLVMTEKGESFVPVFYQVLDNVEQLMTDGFSQEEKETLMTLLQRVLKNIINAEITGSKIPISTKKQI
ncbi:MarR family winged helix-turn-helix transcriptional regulator [Emergencia timonensis]|uniref:MarR family winged helix-turn-helix transcriptional regulator n=1 Tax=Emergencia timonensis TaxID=1776384 RepID=UPI00399530DE